MKKTILLLSIFISAPLCAIRDPRSKRSRTETSEQPPIRAIVQVHERMQDRVRATEEQIQFLMTLVPWESSVLLEISDTVAANIAGEPSASLTLQDRTVSLMPYADHLIQNVLAPDSGATHAQRALTEHIKKCLTSTVQQ